eukprot:tig00001181_g7424.t1
MEAGHPAPPYGASGTSERLIIASVFQHHRLRSMPSMPSTPAERARGSPAPSIERARGSLGDEDFARLKAQELEDSDDDVEIDELPPFVRRLFQEAGTQRHVPVALLRDICSSMFPSAAPEQLEELLRSLDSNRDGLVERRDFVRAFNISPSPLKPRTGPATPASFAPSPGPSTPGASPAPLAGARSLAGHAFEGGATPAASARSIAATAPRLHLRDAAAGRAPWNPAANRPERRASMPPAPRPPSARPPHAPGEQAAVAVGAGQAADEAERAAALREALRQVAAEARGAAEAAARAERAAEAAGREAEASTQREVLELNAGYANLGDLVQALHEQACDIRRDLDAARPPRPPPAALTAPQLARQAAADRRAAAAAGPAPDARALVHRVRRPPAAGPPALRAVRERLHRCRCSSARSPASPPSSPHAPPAPAPPAPRPARPGSPARPVMPLVRESVEGLPEAPGPPRPTSSLPPARGLARPSRRGGGRAARHAAPPRPGPAGRPAAGGDAAARAVVDAAAPPPGRLEPPATTTGPAAVARASSVVEPSGWSAPCAPRPAPPSSASGQARPAHVAWRGAGELLDGGGPEHAVEPAAGGAPLAGLLRGALREHSQRGDHPRQGPPPHRRPAAPLRAAGTERLPQVNAPRKPPSFPPQAGGQAAAGRPEARRTRTLAFPLCLA